jgi:hypothetical protein
LGATLATTSGAANLDLFKRLGADTAIEYNATGFENVQQAETNYMRSVLSWILGSYAQLSIGLFRSKRPKLRGSRDMRSETRQSKFDVSAIGLKEA